MTVPAALARRRSYSGPALFSYGFRPFFLGAALWSAIGVLLWVRQYFGEISLALPEPFSRFDAAVIVAGVIALALWVALPSAPAVGLGLMMAGALHAVRPLSVNCHLPDIDRRLKRLCNLRCLACLPVCITFIE